MDFLQHPQQTYFSVKKFLAYLLSIAIVWQNIWISIAWAVFDEWDYDQPVVYSHTITIKKQEKGYQIDFDHNVLKTNEAIEFLDEGNSEVIALARKKGGDLLIEGKTSAPLKFLGIVRGKPKDCLNNIYLESLGAFALYDYLISSGNVYFQGNSLKLKGGAKIDGILKLHTQKDCIIKGQFESKGTEIHAQHFQIGSKKLAKQESLETIDGKSPQVGIISQGNIDIRSTSFLAVKEGILWAKGSDGVSIKVEGNIDNSGYLLSSGNLSLGVGSGFYNGGRIAAVSGCFHGVDLENKGEITFVNPSSLSFYTAENKGKIKGATCLEFNIKKSFQNDKGSQIISPESLIFDIPGNESVSTFRNKGALWGGNNFILKGKIESSNEGLIKAEKAFVECLNFNHEGRLEIGDLLIKASAIQISPSGFFDFKKNNKESLDHSLSAFHLDISSLEDGSCNPTLLQGNLLLQNPVGFYIRSDSEIVNDFQLVNRLEQENIQNGQSVGFAVISTPSFKNRSLLPLDYYIDETKIELIKNAGMMQKLTSFEGFNHEGEMSPHSKGLKLKKFINKGAISLNYEGENAYLEVEEFLNQSLLHTVNNLYLKGIYGKKIKNEGTFVSAQQLVISQGDLINHGRICGEEGIWISSLMDNRGIIEGYGSHLLKKENGILLSPEGTQVSLSFSDIGVFIGLRESLVNKGTIFSPGGLALFGWHSYKDGLEKKMSPSEMKARRIALQKFTPNSTPFMPASYGFWSHASIDNQGRLDAGDSPLILKNIRSVSHRANSPLPQQDPSYKGLSENDSPIAEEEAFPSFMRGSIISIESALLNFSSLDLASSLLQEPNLGGRIDLLGSVIFSGMSPASLLLLAEKIILDTTIKVKEIYHIVPEYCFNARHSNTRKIDFLNPSFINRGMLEAERGTAIGLENLGEISFVHFGKSDGSSPLLSNFSSICSKNRSYFKNNEGNLTVFGELVLDSNRSNINTAFVNRGHLRFDKPKGVFIDNLGTMIIGDENSADKGQYTINIVNNSGNLLCLSPCPRIDLKLYNIDLLPGFINVPKDLEISVVDKKAIPEMILDGAIYASGRLNVLWELDSRKSFLLKKRPQEDLEQNNGIKRGDIYAGKDIFLSLGRGKFDNQGGRIISGGTVKIRDNQFDGKIHNVKIINDSDIRGMHSILLRGSEIGGKGISSTNGLFSAQGNDLDISQMTIESRDLEAKATRSLLLPDQGIIKEGTLDLEAPELNLTAAYRASHISLTADDIIVSSLINSSSFLKIEGRRKIHQTSKGSLSSLETLLKGDGNNTLEGEVNTSSLQLCGHGITDFSQISRLSPLEALYTEGGTAVFRNQVTIGEAYLRGDLKLERGSTIRGNHIVFDNKKTEISKGSKLNAISYEMTPEAREFHISGIFQTAVNNLVLNVKDKLSIKGKVEREGKSFENIILSSDEVNIQSCFKALRHVCLKASGSLSLLSSSIKSSSLGIEAEKANIKGTSISTDKEIQLHIDSINLMESALTANDLSLHFIKAYLGNTILGVEQNVNFRGENLNIDGRSSVAGTNVIAQVEGDINNKGKISAQQVAQLEANNINVEGIVSAKVASVLKARNDINVSRKGLLKSGNIVAQAAGNINNKGKISAEQVAQLEANNINVDGLISGKEKINLIAQKDIRIQNNGQINSDDIQATAKESIINKGSIHANKNLSSRSLYFTNTGNIKSKNIHFKVDRVFYNGANYASLCSNLFKGNFSDLSSSIGQIEGEQTTIDAMASVNLLGHISSKSLTVNSAIDLNLFAVRSAYNMNINSLISLNAGLNLPRITSWEDIFNTGNLIRVGEKILTTFAPPQVRAVYSLGKTVYKIPQIYQQGKSLYGQGMSLYSKQQENPNEIGFSDLIPLLCGVKGFTSSVFQNASSLCKDGKELGAGLGFLENSKAPNEEKKSEDSKDSAKEPEVKEIENPYDKIKDAVSTVVGSIGPSFNNNSLININLGANLGVNGYEQSLFSYNGGFNAFANTYTQDTYIGFNQGISAASKLNINASQSYKSSGLLGGGVGSVTGGELSIDGYTGFYNKCSVTGQDVSYSAQTLNQNADLSVIAHNNLRYSVEGVAGNAVNLKGKNIDINKDLEALKSLKAVAEEKVNIENKEKINIYGNTEIEATDINLRASTVDQGGTLKAANSIHTQANKTTVSGTSSSKGTNTVERLNQDEAGSFTLAKGGKMEGHQQVIDMGEGGKIDLKKGSETKGSDIALKASTVNEGGVLKAENSIHTEANKVTISGTTSSKGTNVVERLNKDKAGTFVLENGGKMEGHEQAIDMGDQGKVDLKDGSRLETNANANGAGKTFIKTGHLEQKGNVNTSGVLSVDTYTAKLTKETLQGDALKLKLGEHDGGARGALKEVDSLYGMKEVALDMSHKDFKNQENLQLNHSNISGNFKSVNNEANVKAAGSAAFHGKESFTNHANIEAQNGLQTTTDGSHHNEGILSGGKGDNIAKGENITSTQNAKYAGKNVYQEAKQDIIHEKANIESTQDTHLKAGRDVNLGAKEYTKKDEDGSYQAYDPSKLKVGNNLKVEAKGRVDAPMLQADVGGNAEISGDKGVNLDGKASVARKEWDNSNAWGDDKGHREKAKFQQANIKTRGDLSVTSEDGKVSAKGIDAEAGGQMHMKGKEGVDVNALTTTTTSCSQESGWFGLSKRETKESQTEVQGSRLKAGKTIRLESDKGKVEIRSADIKADKIALKGEKGIDARAVETHHTIETTQKGLTLNVLGFDCATPNKDDPDPHLGIKVGYAESTDIQNSQGSAHGNLSANHISVETGEGAQTDLRGANVQGYEEGSKVHIFETNTDKLLLGGTERKESTQSQSWNVTVGAEVTGDISIGGGYSQQTRETDTHDATTFQVGQLVNHRKDAKVEMGGGIKADINETSGQQFALHVEHAQAKESQDGFSAGGKIGCNLPTRTPSVEVKGSYNTGEKASSAGLTQVNIGKGSNFTRTDAHHKDYDTRLGFEADLNISKEGVQKAGLTAKVGDDSFGLTYINLNGSKAGTSIGRGFQNLVKVSKAAEMLEKNILRNGTSLAHRAGVMSDEQHEGYEYGAEKFHKINGWVEKVASAGEFYVGKNEKK